MMQTSRKRKHVASGEEHVADRKKMQRPCTVQTGNSQHAFSTRKKARTLGHDLHNRYRTTIRQRKRRNKNLRCIPNTSAKQTSCSADIKEHSQLRDSKQLRNRHSPQSLESTCMRILGVNRGIREEEGAVGSAGHPTSATATTRLRTTDDKRQWPCLVW